jgi:hypothetical protein
MVGCIVDARSVGRGGLPFVIRHGKQRLVFFVYASLQADALDPVLRILFRQGLKTVVLRWGENPKDMLP